MPNVKIWEKHVEWEFARNYVSTARAVTPLDGSKEYGDAICAADAVWWILEFKARSDGLDTERAKYPCFSASRALAVAGRGNKKSTAQYKVLKAAIAGQQSQFAITKTLLRWERCFFPNTFKQEVFHRAFEATKWLVRNYQFFDSSGKLPVGEAPHLIVYPADEFLTRLSAHRYWKDWIKYDNGPRVKVPSASKDLAVHLASKGPLTTFIDYVVQLATARGYVMVSPAPGTWHVANYDDLGNVLAYGRLTDGTTVMLPLSEILAWLPHLNTSIQLPLRPGGKP